MQKYMIELMMATSATRPIVRPTAAPVLSPPPLLLFFVVPNELPEVGGTVGVTVTVRIWPVTVSSEVTGVGVQVEEDSLVGLEVVRMVDEVEEDEELVVLSEDDVGVKTTVTESGAAVTVTCAALEVVDDAAVALLAPFVPDGARFNAMYP
jgi:hypothetical protein